jgi:segregation and condensation protein B
MLSQVTTLLYLSGDPIEIKKIASILETSEESIKGLLPELEKGLEAVGLQLLISNGEISIVTQASNSNLIEAFWKRELEGELTPAALQVLTLTAYLGNPTREEISYIRGVQSSLSIRTLTVRGLITRNGEVCTLTSDALKSLGVSKVEDLPEYETTHAGLREKLAARSS